MIGTAPETLAVARDLVKPRLIAALARLQQGTRLVAGYHLGWYGADGQATGEGGGKSLRPALAFLSARAARRPPEDALPGAVAIELVHKFSLLHDDVMDRDEERRHRSTAWKAFGIPRALLAGDALLVLAYEELLDCDSPHRVAAVRRVTAAVADLIRGQGSDLDFESRIEVSVSECLTMSAQKTAGLISAAAAIGAELAGAPASLVEGLAAFGTHLGLAFQAVDDLLGIWGASELTGKPVGSDLRERKKTLPIVAALSGDDGVGEDLHEFLALPGLSEEDTLRGTLLLERAGSREWVADLAQRERAAAIEALDPLPIPEDTRSELMDIATFVTTREF